MVNQIFFVKSTIFVAKISQLYGPTAPEQPSTPLVAGHSDHWQWQQSAGWRLTQWKVVDQ
jgi:hypothetical protein